jgi:hypothetical protein
LDFAFFYTEFCAEKDTIQLTRMSTEPDDDYQWPENLYMEMRDMAATSFFVYSFAYAADVARKVGLKGLNVSPEGKVTMPSRDLPRSFTPKEVLKIIEENRKELKEEFHDTFGDTKKYELLIKNLKTLEGRQNSIGGGIGVQCLF